MCPASSSNRGNRGFTRPLPNPLLYRPGFCHARRVVSRPAPIPARPARPWWRRFPASFAPRHPTRGSRRLRGSDRLHGSPLGWPPPGCLRAFRPEACTPRCPPDGSPALSEPSLSAALTPALWGQRTRTADRGIRAPGGYRLRRAWRCSRQSLRPPSLPPRSRLRSPLAPVARRPPRTATPGREDGRDGRCLRSGFP